MLLEPREDLPLEAAAGLRHAAIRLVVVELSGLCSSDGHTELSSEYVLSRCMPSDMLNCTRLSPRSRLTRSCQAGTVTLAR